MRFLPTWYLALVCVLAVVAGTLLTSGYLSSERVKYPSESVDPQGVMSPALISSADVHLKDDEPVFGIVVDGQARAYQKRAFKVYEPHHRMGRHVVNDLVGRQQVTIVHCDRVDCTRVFLGNVSENPLKVAVKGWDTDKGMILVVDGSLYALESPDIPLKELDYNETSWATWHREHPDTRVYLDSASKIVNVN